MKLHRRALLGVLAAAASLAVAAPMASASTVSSVVAQDASTNCAAQSQSLSQPFLAWGDSNEYVLAPGQTPDAVNGSGWTLLGGASITGATVADGSQGSVLDLPAGAVAISAPICVQSTYPTARAMLQGGQVQVGAVYADALAGGVTPQLLASSYDGAISGGASFAPSPEFQVNPGQESGWQVMQFVFANTSPSDAQLYDLYVDPRMSF